MSFLSTLDSFDLNFKYKIKCIEVFSFIQPLLSYLPREIGDYTDHGVLHCENLLNIFINFQNNIGQIFFSEEEKYVIILSIILHDIGCIINRCKHNEHSIMLLESDRFITIRDLIENQIFTCVKYIILSHSFIFDLQTIPKLIHPKIRLRLICSIFRLIDSCDITKSRTKDLLFYILQKYADLSNKAKDHWMAHKNIESIFFVDNIILIKIYDEQLTKILINHLLEDLEKINKIFIEYEIKPYEIKTEIVPEQLITET